MFVFLYLCLSLLVQSYAEIFEEITITEYENVENEVRIPSTLEVNKYLRIKIINRKNNDIYTNINCHFSQNPKHFFINSFLERQNIVYTTKVIIITKDMVTQWTCHVFNVKKDEVNIINFEIKIKAPGGKYVSLFVNEERMNITDFNKDKKKGMDFDAKVEYKYMAGELVNVRCLKKEGNNIGKRFTLFNGTKILETNLQSYKTDERVYIKLTKAHHASYFDCTVKLYYLQETEFTVRLLFLMSSTSVEPVVSVNALTLAPTSGNVYLYEYYSEESLTILGHSKNPLSNIWNCMYGKDEKLKPIEDQHNSINVTVILDYSKLMSSTVNCLFGNSLVYLKLNPMNLFEPFIHGLSMSKILLAYQENEYSYIMKYDNKGNANLNITCSFKKTGCEWKFNRTRFIAEDNKFIYSSVTNRYSSNMLIKVISNIDEDFSTISCICTDKNPYNFTVIVTNQREKILTTTDSGDVLDLPQITTSLPVSDLGTSYNDPESSEQDEPGLGNELLIGLIIGTFLIVIIVVWIIVGLHKRKKKEQEVQASDINYENLPDHNEGPMPVPPQWNDYTTSPTEETYTYCEPYVAKNVEDMYAQPQPKSQRQAELLYAEVGAQEPAYAAVGQESKTLYVNTKKNEMPTYSQIQKRGPGTAPKVLPKPVNNENYAVVVPKSIRNKEYANVFKDERYMNSQAKGEYAEPAYCEVSKTK